MSSLITVYILAYNRPNYLRECLESVVCQTLHDFKIVVLDNASSTDLKSVVNDVEKNSGRVINYLRHSQNIQSFGNFLYAWKDPKTTPYFIIFHDDDIMHPEFLERSTTLIHKFLKPAWIGSQSVEFKGKKPVFPILCSDSPLHFSAAELAHRILTSQSNVTFSTVIYRSNLTKVIDLENLCKTHSILFDRPLLFALAKLHGCILSPQPFILYRCHEAQDSSSGPLNEDNLLSLFKAYKQALQPIWDAKVQQDFYSWSGFHIPDSFNRLSLNKRSSFRKYLQKARQLDVYRDSYLRNYMIGATRLLIKRIARRISRYIQNLGMLLLSSWKYYED